MLTTGRYETSVRPRPGCRQSIASDLRDIQELPGLTLNFQWYQFIDGLLIQLEVTHIDYIPSLAPSC